MDRNDFEPQLCIVQLTDFHFGEELQVNCHDRVDDILETIKSSITSGAVLLLVTGDIAYSGKKKEYQSASLFFDYLIEQLDKLEYRLIVYLLPGNHDLQGPRKSTERFVDTQYDLDVKKMASFYEFANQYGNQFVLGQPDSITFEVEGTQVSVSGFNSAPLSTLVGDDKGFHLLRSFGSSLLGNTPDSGLHIFASHHGPEWFLDNDRLNLEKMLSNSFDFAFTGHEHMGQSRCVGGLTGESCVVVRGGTYSLYDDNQSSYKMVLIRFGELGSYEFVERVYGWDVSARVHTPIDEDCSYHRYIKSKTYFRPRSDFVNELFKSEGNSNESFKDSFVFPSLKEEIATGTKDGELRINDQKIITDIHSFMELLLDAKTLEIHSDIREGKSSLLKAIYRESLSMGYSPLLLTPDYSTGSISRTLSTIIEDQYGDTREAVERFRRIPREKVLLLVDDFDSLKRKAKKSDVIKSMLRTAGNIVLITDISFPFELDETVEADFRHLLICPWTKNKRDELIQKRCKDTGLSDEQVDELIAIVDKAVHSHFQLFDMTPPFINQYIDFYIYESGAFFIKGDLPFTSIMNTNVKRKIRNAVSDDEKQLVDELADAVIAVLMKLALKIHSDRTVVFSSMTFSQVAESYLNDYGIPADPKTIMDVSVQSGVLVVKDNGYEYSFASRSLYAYFVAQAIDLELDEDVDKGESYVLRLLDELDFSINEEILVLLEGTRFIPWLTQKLVEKASDAVNGSDVIFSKGKTYECLSGLEGLKIAPPSQEGTGAIRSVTDEMEQRNCEAIERVSYAGVYEYEVPKARNAFQSAIIALKYVAIAGRCLNRQQVKLKESLKATARERIYCVTGAALNLLLTAIDESYDEMVEDVASQLDSPEEARPIIRRLLSMVALSGCIGQLDTVASNACGPLSVLGFSKIIDESDFYSLFMLALYLRSNSEKKFCNVAKKSIKTAREHAAWPLIVAITVLSAGYIVEHPHMSKSARHSLIDNVFNGDQKVKARLLKTTQA